MYDVVIMFKYAGHHPTAHAPKLKECEGLVTALSSSLSQRAEWDSQASLVLAGSLFVFLEGRSVYLCSVCFDIIEVFEFRSATCILCMFCRF